MQDTNTTKPGPLRSIRKPTGLESRPWTPADLRVRALATSALESARACAALGQKLEAIKYCLGGLCVTDGFTRPLAIRDQIVDFMRRVDPDGSIQKTFVIASLDPKPEPAE